MEYAGYHGIRTFVNPVGWTGAGNRARLPTVPVMRDRPSTGVRIHSMGTTLA